MKICIIVPNIPQSEPYVAYYTKVFNDQSVAFDIICWDRNEKLKDLGNSCNYCLVYTRRGYESNSWLRKTLDYFGFVRFVNAQLSLKKYDLLIVCNLALGFYMCKTLIIRYRRKFIIDIRDYSPIMSIFSLVVFILCKYSALNVVSSMSYLNWLPRSCSYVMSHNIAKEFLSRKVNSDQYFGEFKFQIPSIIITIGQLRDFSANRVLIDNLGQSENFRLKFCGDGIDRLRLEEYSKNQNANCIFTGWYNKLEEQNLVSDCDFINIVLPESNHTMEQMTNRFYLSLLCRKPMIVNKKSTQSYYVDKYYLGLSVDLQENFDERILEFIRDFDSNLYLTGVDKMISIVQEDIDKFEYAVSDVLSNSGLTRNFFF